MASVGLAVSLEVLFADANFADDRLLAEGRAHLSDALGLRDLDAGDAH